jgi:hypothetical protein
MIFMTLFFLGVAATLGVLSATYMSCGVDMMSHPMMTCDAEKILPFGIAIGAAFALLIGYPTSRLFMKLKYFRCWQFVLGATLIATPFYVIMGEPFKTDWADNGRVFFILYLGSGAFSGLYYWVFECIFKYEDVVLPDEPST